MGSTERSIVLVCEDVGAAAALAPVAQRLLAQHRNPAISARGQAAAIFASKCIPFGGPESVAVSAATGVVVTGTTAWGERIEAHAIRKARSLHVPTLSFVDFWSNYRERLTLTQEFDVLPDRLLVVDSVMYDDLRALELPTELVITGSPVFDEIKPLAPPSDGSPVLFLSQPLSKLATVEYDEHTVIALVATACVRLGVELRVRPHPREDRTELATFLATLAGTTISRSDASLMDDVVSSCGVVGMTTMALVEAALTGRATLSVQLTYKPILLPTIRSELTVMVQTQPQLASAVARLVAGARQSRPIGDYFLADSAARVVAVIDDILRNGELRAHD